MENSDWLISFNDDFAALLYYHNEIRKSQSIKILNVHYMLSSAAMKYAKWMNNKKILRHGILPEHRIRSEGYKQKVFGENIIYGPKNSSETIIELMKNHQQRENILDERFKHVGFGKDDKYWCIIYGNK